METSTGHPDPGHTAAGEVEFHLSVKEAERRQRALGVRRSVSAVLRAESVAREAGGPGAGTGTGTGEEWRMPPGGLGILIAVDFAQDRLKATREAVSAAIEALPDGVRFALLEERADVHGVPRQPEWEVAGLWQRSRAQAAAGWMQLNAPPEFGTRYSDWLAQARATFERTGAGAGPAPDIRHLLMITDGTSGRTPRLASELDACAGKFTCDVLGVGDRWEPDVLTEISERLHGTAECVRGGGQVTARLTRMVDQLLRTRVPMVPLEVTVRPGVELLEVLQLAPRRRLLEPLTAPDGEPAGGQSGRPRRHVFATRLWAEAEIREYELVLGADPTGDPLDEEIQLAAVTLAPASAPASPSASASVLVRWFHEGAGAARPGPWAARGVTSPVTYHGDHTKLHRAFVDGCKALDRGERSVALQQLGTAARLAHELQDTASLDLVRQVAQVLDAAHGQVRLLPAVDPVALLETRMYSQRVPVSPVWEEDGDGPASTEGELEPELVDCPRQCGRAAVRGARHCVGCGAAL